MIERNWDIIDCCVWQVYQKHILVQIFYIVLYGIHKHIGCNLIGLVSLWPYFTLKYLFRNRIKAAYCSMFLKMFPCRLAKSVLLPLTCEVLTVVTRRITVFPDVSPLFEQRGTRTSVSRNALSPSSWHKMAVWVSVIFWHLYSAAEKTLIFCDSYIHTYVSVYIFM
jgi:hypothetical protein